VNAVSPYRAPAGTLVVGCVLFLAEYYGPSGSPPVWCPKRVTSVRPGRHPALGTPGWFVGILGCTGYFQEGHFEDLGRLAPFIDNGPYHTPPARLQPGDLIDWPEWDKALTAGPRWARCQVVSVRIEPSRLVGGPVRVAWVQPPTGPSHDAYLSLAASTPP
jgi:hypothetical protein